MDYATLVKQYPGYASWNDQTSALNDYAATGGQGKGGATSSAGSSGTSNRVATGIDESQLPSTLDYITKLNATEDTAFNDLLMAMKARKSPLDVYTGLEEAAGLPALRTTATSLSKEIGNIEDTLEGIEPNVAARTKESLVTQAQRTGMVNAQSLPYQKTLGKLTTGLGRLSNLITSTGQEIGTKANLFMQGQAQEIEPLQMKYTALVDRNARNLSGFTSDKETKLQILMDKLNRQQTLDDQEWSLANSLTADAKSYHQQLETAAASAGAKLSGAETDDQLLSLIGNQAAAKLAKEGAGAGATTAQKNAYTKELSDKAKAGYTLGDLRNQYAGKLSLEEIVKAYTGSSPYGAPNEPWAKEILGTNTSTSTFDQATYDAYIKAGYSDAAARVMATQ